MAGGASAVKEASSSAAPAPGAAAGAAAAAAPQAPAEGFGMGPADHYKLYSKNLQRKNAAVAAGLLLFVGGVYVYTMRAVGSSDELAKAVEVYERQQQEQQQQQVGQIAAKPA